MAITFKSLGSSQIEIDSASISERGTIRDLLDSLEAMTPGIKARILDETGQLRRFLNIYINSEDIRFLDGLETLIQDGDELSIVPAVAGGFDPAVAEGSINIEEENIEEENIEEENIEYTRIMMVMERSFQEFDEQKKEDFLNDLSMISGCLEEDFKGVFFRSGCVIFEAKLPKESVERILEIWEFIQNQEDSDIEATLKVNADDLKDLNELIKKHTISKIKGNINIPYPIVKNSSEHESESKAIVFVHGWRGGKDSFGQMPEFLCEYEDINCSNEIYSYPTSWIEGKSIVFISRNLDNWIRRKCKQNGYQKLAFVAHSMGGLVVKKFLVNQVCRDKPVTGYVKEITFIATPHNGAVLAKLPKLIPGINTSQVSELSAGSPFLIDLNDQWSAWTRMFVPKFCRYGSIFGTDDEVVDTTNTPDKDLDTVYILGAKHVNIVKPKSPDDEVVATVIDFLQEANF